MPVMLSVQVQRFKDLGENGPDPLMRFPTPTAATKPWPGPTGPAAISLSRRPASTKSNLAITKIFPELTGKLNGRAVRVLTCRYCGAELKIIALFATFVGAIVTSIFAVMRLEFLSFDVTVTTDH